MITPQEATNIINNHLFHFPSETVELQQAHGCILREKVQADRDFPPFDRVTMDGIAYSFDELDSNKPELIVGAMQLAGEPQKERARTGSCMEVMTGAVTPRNTDTVTPYEDIDIREEGGKKIATIRKLPSRKGLNVHAQGYDRTQGEELITPGVYLGPAQIAIAASVGKAQIAVTEPPKAAIISTGDELVAVNDQPQPYQIRQSNNYALRAALSSVHVSSTFYHLPDSLEKTTQGLEEAMEEHPIIVLSGGVSRGKRDYVPEALEALGVKKLFHKIKQRPGKPFWFGVRDDKNVVFALPGNPVSTFMCFHRYLKPWLDKSMGLSQQSTQWATLNDHVKFEPALTYYLQVMAHPNEEGQLSATPIEGHGSGDFANLLHCNGFLELPSDRSHFRQGEVFPFIPFVR